MLLAPTISSRPQVDPSPSVRTARWSRPVHVIWLQRRMCAATVGAEDSSRRRMRTAHFSWIFYLTYIVHVNKGHKIHKNTILLCRTALFQTHSPVFSFVLLAHTLPGILEVYILMDEFPSFIFECHNNNYSIAFSLSYLPHTKAKIFVNAKNMQNTEL